MFDNPVTWIIPSPLFASSLFHIFHACLHHSFLKIGFSFLQLLVPYACLYPSQKLYILVALLSLRSVPLVGFFGGREVREEAGKLVGFSCDSGEAESTMTASGFDLCPHASIVSDVSGSLRSCSVVGIICGPGQWPSGCLGVCPAKAEPISCFLFKKLLPKLIVLFLALINFFFPIWSSARSFSLGNGVLHQKIYCHKKAKLFPGALSGISNGSLSLELNFPWDNLFPSKCKQASRL